MFVCLTQRNGQQHWNSNILFCDSKRYLFLTVEIYIKQMTTTNSNLCYKIILIGNCKVGKTSFLNYVIGRSVSQKSVTPTIGVEYAPVNIKVGSNDIRVNIWDTSGAEQYKSITRSYYRKCHGAIVMFDITERKSFEDLKLWLQEIKNEIRSKMPKIIIANKFDLVESGQRQRAITEKEVVDFCVENNLIFKETSAMTGFNVRETFSEFVQGIYEWKGRNEEEQSSGGIYNSSVSLQKEKPKSTESQSLNCARCC